MRINQYSYGKEQHRKLLSHHLSFRTRKSNSIVDGLLVRDKILHRLDFFRRVSLPIKVFAQYPQRLAGAVGLRRIAWILPVRHIRVIHKRSRRFYHVDSARAFTLCQFRSPGSREYGLAEVDPGRLPLGVVGGIARLKQVSGLQVSFGAMIETSRVGEDERCRGIAYLFIHIVTSS